MKKLFTLIAAALMAVSANASSSTAISDKNIDYSSATQTWTAGWQWATIVQYSSGDYTIDKTAHTATDENVTYGDASAYDYLILEYSSSTCEVGIYVQYQTNGTQTGDNGYPNFYQDEATASVSTSGGFAALKLDSEKKSTISTVNIMNKAAGSIVITGFYWATEEEYEAVKAADDAKEKLSVLEENGTYELEGGANWVTGKQPSIDVTKYNALVVEVASSTNACELVVQDGSWSNFGKIEIEKSTTAKTYILDITSLEKLSQYAFSNSTNTDATTVVLTKVYLTSKTADEVATAISSVKAAAEAEDNVYYNLSGQRVAKPSKGLYIQNGKKVIVK